MPGVLHFNYYLAYLVEAQKTLKYISMIGVGQRDEAIIGQSNNRVVKSKNLFFVGTDV